MAWLSGSQIIRQFPGSVLPFNATLVAYGEEGAFEFLVPFASWKSRCSGRAISEVVDCLLNSVPFFTWLIDSC